MSGSARAASPPDPEVISNLFEGVSYFLNNSIPPTLRAKLELLLLSHGAESCPEAAEPDDGGDWTFSNRFDVDFCTHVISDTADLPEGEWLAPPIWAPPGTINLPKKPVQLVSPLWVTRSIDLQNLQLPTFYSPMKHLIFSGMCFCTSDLPEADNLAISAGVSSLGGQWKRELTREVTHLFVVAPQGPKHAAAMKYGPELGMVVLLPHWFEECLKLSTLVPIEPYQFPEPPLLRLDQTADVVPFAERMEAYLGSLPPPHKKMPQSPPTATADAFGPYPFGPDWGKDTLGLYQKTATVNLNRNLLAPLPDAWRNSDSAANSTLIDTDSAPVKRWPSHVRLADCASQIFQGQSVYFASDLGLREGLEDALRARVIAAGGTCFSWSIDARRDSLVPSHSQWERRKVAERALREADIVVTKTREGWEYWLAFDRKKRIGNLAWIYHVLAAGVLSSPFDRILHYPIPHTRGVQGFHNLVFTISNYAGPARDYVRTLIETLGASFQGAMTKRTDYVVSASDFGAKVEHAKTWAIPLVTHIWLEQCLVEWRLVNPASSQAYIAPVHKDTNFAAIVGQAELPRGAVERWAQEIEQQTQREMALRPVEEGESSREEDNSFEREANKTEFAMEVDPVVESRTATVAGPSSGPSRDLSKLSAKKPSPEPVAEEEEEEEEPPTAEVDDEVPIEVDHEDEAAPAAEDDSPATPPKARKPTKAKTATTPKSPASKPTSKARGKAKALPPATPSDASLSSSDDDRPRAPPVGSAGARVDATNILPARSKRGVALAAANKLHNQMADANRFAVEQRGSAKKRRRGSSGAPPTPAPAVVSRGKSKSKDVESDDESEEDVGDKARAKGKGKRTRAVKDEDEEEEDSVVVEEPKKPARAKKVAGGGRAAELKKDAAKPSPDVVSSFDNPPHAKPPALNKAADEDRPMRIMSTGLGLDAKHPDIKRLLKLSPGSSWTEQPPQVTHLVVKAMSRTEKFLCALAAAPLIVTQDWVTDCLKQGRIVPEGKYLLKDKAKEKEMGDTLVAILARAKARKVFDGLTIYLTPNIEPALGTIKKIVLSGGGIVSNASLKTVSSTSSLKDALLAKPPTAYVVSCAKDRPLWDALASARERVVVYSVEAVLQSAMYQKVIFEPRHRIDLQVDR